MKRCIDCHEEKRESDFNKRARSKDGLTATCRDCTKVRAAAQRIRSKAQRNAYDKKRREQYPEYAREWRAAHAEQVRQYHRSYQQSHPSKYKPKPKRSRPSVAERFWAHVDTSGECWVWTGNRYPRGYGHFSHTGYAHRVSYTLAYGEIPPGMCVCHRCDNPPCVRPDHLFLGTHADNMHDRDRKGRGKTPTK